MDKIKSINEFKELSTFEIWNYATKDPLIKSQLRGIFAADQIPITKFGKSLYIINSDPFSKPGKHWIAVYFSPKNVIFFCSLGRNPTYYHKKIQLFIKKEKKAVIYNKLRLQSKNSATCGYYCLLFALAMTRNISLPQLLTYFSQNTEANDILVKRITKKYFNII